MRGRNLTEEQKRERLVQQLRSFAVAIEGGDDELVELVDYDDADMRVGEDSISVEVEWLQ